jgi:predicted CopG family antitoxin
MKTIAIKERTFQILHELKKKEKAKSFDELLTNLIVKPSVPCSMRGSLKGKAKPFTRKEREEMWIDANREI